jgi:hypothetical protein
MRLSILAGAVLVGLALIGSPLQGQRVSAEVGIHAGPVAGRVTLGDGYSTYHRRPIVVRRASRIVVVERYGPRVIVVERFRHRPSKHWKRGYRAVIVYYFEGRYYDRFNPYHPGARKIVVYERGGRFYRDWEDGRRHRHGNRNDRDRGDWGGDDRDD